MESKLSRRKFLGLGGSALVGILFNPLSRVSADQTLLYRDFSTIELEQARVYADGEEASKVYVVARNFLGDVLTDFDIKSLEALKGLIKQPSRKVSVEQDSNNGVLVKILGYNDEVLEESVYIPATSQIGEQGWNVVTKYPLSGGAEAGLVFFTTTSPNALFGRSDIKDSLNYTLISPTTQALDSLEAIVAQQSTGKLVRLRKDISYRPSFVVETDSKFISKMVKLNGQKISQDLTFLRGKLFLSRYASLDVALKETDENALYFMFLDRNRNLVALLKDSGVNGLKDPRILKFSEVGEANEFEDVVLFNDKYGNLDLKELLISLGSRGTRTDYGIFLRDLVNRFWVGNFVRPEEHLDITVVDPLMSLCNGKGVDPFKTSVIDNETPISPDPTSVADNFVGKVFVKVKNYSTKAYRPKELFLSTEFPELSTVISNPIEQELIPRGMVSLYQDFSFGDVNKDILGFNVSIDGLGGKIYTSRNVRQISSDCGKKLKKKSITNDNPMDLILPEIIKAYDK